MAQALRAELDTLRSDTKGALTAAVHKEVRAAMVQLGVSHDACLPHDDETAPHV